MATWSGIRKKLEKDYLAENLRGHIKYYATSYSKSSDHEGRAAILYDGKEILKGCYWNNWTKAHLFPKDDKFENRMNCEMAYMDDTALKLGVFDQRSFYEAFDEFDNQNIDESLDSENMLVRIFAILDRRVGKRKLLKIGEHILSEPDIFRMFFIIRIHHERIGKASKYPLMV